MPPVNNFAFDDGPVARSFIYTENSSGPNTNVPYFIKGLDEMSRDNKSASWNDKLDLEV